ncbi:MAG: sialic acid synthase SpsE [Acidimicrobiales bacterium]|jgi:sialic acid synthase SpsE
MNRSVQKSETFNDLFIFEMSKNHAGDVDCALEIVDSFAEISQGENLHAAIKLQFRDLDSYIHPQFKKDGDERMQRYFSSHLTTDEFKQIVDRIHEKGLISMSTPFDELSVDVIDALGVDMIKIASSSATDWPLLERVVLSKKPIVVSTGGLKLEDIDALVTFLQKNGADFVILHCVGMYPTPREYKELHRIKLFVQRYPNVPIGFSTHEDPENLIPVQLAYALGARCFEKHVIVLDEKSAADPSYQKVLGYTATPEQTKAWIYAYKDAVIMLGTEDIDSYQPTEKEINSIASMKRGVYLKHDMSAGQTVSSEDVFFAIPLQDGQMECSDWREGLQTSASFAKEDPLTHGNVSLIV